MKERFDIKESFRFEWGDLVALTQLINVILIISLGLVAAWFGLALAVIGIVIDFLQHKHINNIIMRITMIVLNIHFLRMYYLV